MFIIGRIKNQKQIQYGGLTFDSQMELDYYLYLSKNPKVKHINLQPKYILQPTFRKNGETHRSITYKADFHIIWNDGSETVVDVKGQETEMFKLKRKLFEYQFPEKQLAIIKGVYDRKLKSYTEFLTLAEWRERNEKRKSAPAKPGRMR